MGKVHPPVIRDYTVTLAKRTHVNVKRPGDRTFGLVFAALFGAVALIGWLAFGRLLGWALAVSGLLLLLALVSPGILMPLNRLWVWFGHRIAFVVNHVLLGSFFFLVISPFGLGARLFRAISISKRPDPEADSYWTEVGRRASVESYSDMF